MGPFLQAVASGLILASIHAGMTVGLTLICGALRRLNMAHGTLTMIGGFVAWIAAVSFGLPSLIGAGAAFVVAFVLGIAIYRLAVAPLIGHRDFELVGFISTLAVAMIAQNLMLVVFGARNKPVDPLLPGSLPLPFQITVTWHQVLMATIAIVVLPLLQLFLTRSRHGLAVVAVAQNLDGARLVGDARQIYAATMGLSAGLAAIAGVLLAPIFFVSPNAGDLPLLKAIIVAIFGGLGSTRGTIVAAFVIGLVGVRFAHLGAKFALPVLFAVVFVALTIQPYGLFGLSQETRLGAACRGRVPKARSRATRSRPSLSGRRSAGLAQSSCWPRSRSRRQPACRCSSPMSTCSTSSA